SWASEPFVSDLQKLYYQEAVLSGLRTLVPDCSFTGDTEYEYLQTLDADKAKFERGGICFTTIPDLEVVGEKHYAWALPVIVGGIATNNGGVPWGFLASVNDVFKTAQSDEDQNGPLHAAHPDLLGGGLTYTSIHELSHFLGLAHPHDTIGASVVTQSDGTKKTEYWDGFSWTFDSTAAPTTYAF